MNATEEQKKQVQDWVTAAIADGWEIEATYPGLESKDRAAHLRRDGFVVSILRREPIPGHWCKVSEYNMTAWGPDGLALKLPTVYSWKAVNDALGMCGECGKVVKHVQRAAFCNRVCDACLRKARAKYEQPGWCD